MAIRTVSRVVSVSSVPQVRTPRVIAPYSQDFVTSSLTPKTNESVTFLATGRPSSPNFTYSWNFGDGGTATGVSVAHAFSSAGVYLVTLTIDDAPPASRDPLLWPFIEYSIWNLPIGANASYVWAGIATPTDMAFFCDADILCLKPSAPSTAIQFNDDDWGAGTRCADEGGDVLTVPIPSTFRVPGNHQGSPDGDTPNSCAVFLESGGDNLRHTQPFAWCEGFSVPTSHYTFDSAPFAIESLTGTGNTGSHGGSGLSALGGTIRLGELVHGGKIQHALKLNIDAVNFWGGTHPDGGGGYRWPAVKSDAGGSGYTGSVQACTMGSLLALKPGATAGTYVNQGGTEFAISNLETEPGRIMAQAMLDYGCYNCDSAGWSVCGIPTERSPDGAVQDEFLAEWGFALNATINQNGWARDMVNIFTKLWAVDNWNSSSWTTVSGSGGTQGAGGGAPRVAWAPPLA